MWAGLRISELMALGWDDIDLTKGTAHIQIAKVEDTYKTTKTRGSNRIVELLSPAFEAINQQIELTYDNEAIEISVLQSDNKTIKKKMFRPVFVNTFTSEPHCNYHSLRDRFW